MLASRSKGPRFDPRPGHGNFLRVCDTIKRGAHINMGGNRSIFWTKLCPFFYLKFSKCSYSRALAPACVALVYKCIRIDLYYSMEMFVDSCSQMLLEFKVLLTDHAISPTRLLQLMAINMFAIENTALKGNHHLI